jgi:hypothetical protein
VAKGEQTRRGSGRAHGSSQAGLWLPRECFEYWRHLWDDRATDIAIVFVGGGDCYQVLRREPMLSSRV